MNKEKSVIEYYVLCNKLKDVVRTGWKSWNVKRKRVESIAEHIFGTQMLAIAMWSEFEYDIDLKKVLTMLAVHETEEIIIGDFTPFQISREKKQELGHKAVEKIFNKLYSGDVLKKIVFEFDERKTPEAQFAFYCDKLECDIQCKLYDEQHCVDLKENGAIDIKKNKLVSKLIENGSSWSDMWIGYSQEKNGYDENFMAVSNYVRKNKILENQEENERG